MRIVRCLSFGFAICLLLLGTGVARGEGLVWDALSKTNHHEFGETNSIFSFVVTNISQAEITINNVRTSCGCTVAKLPMLPWKLAPGAHGEMGVRLDIRGKQGKFSKYVSIDSTEGLKWLVVNASIEAPDRRQMNQMLALADRQAIFRSDCASCHVQPAVAKHGQELFAAACGICHEAEHRASMVPDLKALTKPTDADYWRMWITKGQPGTLMPAFSKNEGGPLDDAQVNSLVEYLTKVYRPQLDLGNPFAFE